MSYSIVQKSRQEASVEILCGALGVSVSGYYLGWRSREPSQRQQTDTQLLEHIQTAYQAGRSVYGSPRIHAALQTGAALLPHKRVVRLMQENGVRSRRRPKRRIQTTDSRHNSQFTNLLQRDFSATGLNQKWVGDMALTGRTKAGYTWQPFRYLPSHRWLGHEPASRRGTRNGCFMHGFGSTKHSGSSSLNPPYRSR